MTAKIYHWFPISEKDNFEGVKSKHHPKLDTLIGEIRTNVFNKTLQLPVSPFVLKLCQTVYHVRPLEWIHHLPNEIIMPILRKFQKKISMVSEDMEDEFAFLTKELSSRQLTIKKTHYLCVLGEHALKLLLTLAPIPESLQVHRKPYNPLHAISYQLTNDPALHIISNSSEEHLEALLSGKFKQQIRDTDVVQKICATLSIHNKECYHPPLVQECLSTMRSCIQWTRSAPKIDHENGSSHLHAIQSIVSILRLGNRLRKVSKKELSHFALWKSLGPIVYCYSDPLEETIKTFINERCSPYMGHTQSINLIRDAVLEGLLPNEGLSFDAALTWIETNNINYLNLLQSHFNTDHCSLFFEEIHEMYDHLLKCECTLLEKEIEELDDSHDQIPQDQALQILMEKIQRRCLPLGICISEQVNSALDTTLIRLQKIMCDHFAQIKTTFGKISFDDCEDPLEAALLSFQKLLVRSSKEKGGLDYASLGPKLVEQLRTHLTLDTSAIFTSDSSSNNSILDATLDANLDTGTLPSNSNSSSSSSSSNASIKLPITFHNKRSQLDAFHNKRSQLDAHEGVQFKRSKIRVNDKILNAYEDFRNEAFRKFAQLMRSMPFLSPIEVESHLRTCISDGSRKAASHFYHTWWYQIRSKSEIHVLNDRSWDNAMDVSTAFSYTDTRNFLQSTLTNLEKDLNRTQEDLNKFLLSTLSETQRNTVQDLIRKKDDLKIQLKDLEDQRKLIGSISSSSSSYNTLIPIATEGVRTQIHKIQVDIRQVQADIQKAYSSYMTPIQAIQCKHLDLMKDSFLDSIHNHSKTSTSDLWKRRGQIKKHIETIYTSYSSSRTAPRPPYELAIEYATVTNLEQRRDLQTLNVSQTIQEIRKTLIENIPIFYPQDSQLLGQLKKSIKLFSVGDSLNMMPTGLIQLIWQYHGGSQSIIMDPTPSIDLHHNATSMTSLSSPKALSSSRSPSPNSSSSLSSLSSSIAPSIIIQYYPATSSSSRAFPNSSPSMISLSSPKAPSSSSSPSSNPLSSLSSLSSPKAPSSSSRDSIVG